MNAQQQISQNKYCVYYHKNKGEVFYIGAGKIDRPFTLTGRSIKWRAYVNSLAKKSFQVEIEVVRSFTTKTEALRFEKEEIKRLQPNTNVTDNPLRKMEILLIRFTRQQRVKIRRETKRLRLKSEAEYVRRCVDNPLYQISLKTSTTLV